MYKEYTSIYPKLKAKPHIVDISERIGYPDITKPNAQGWQLSFSAVYVQT
jgi:hypothetical protein